MGSIHEEMISFAIFLVCLIVIIRCCNWLNTRCTDYLQAFNPGKVQPVKSASSHSQHNVPEVEDPFERHMLLATGHDYVRMPCDDFAYAEDRRAPVSAPAAAPAPARGRSSFRRRISNALTPSQNHNYVLKGRQRKTLADELDGYDYEWDQV